MEIRHGDNWIWNMELDSYNRVLISEMYLDTIIIIEKQYGSEDLFPFIKIKRISEDELEGAIAFDYMHLPPDEIMATEFEYVHKVCPTYKFLLIGAEKELGVTIREDMSIKQAVDYILIYSDLLYDDIIQRGISCRSRLFASYIDSMLPVYRRAMARVKLELENFALDNKENASKIVDICGRVKKIDSIIEKINRKQINKFDVFERFDDIAGVRCICEYLDDVYDVLEYIKNNPLLSVIEIDDKIEKSTTEGYRGIHVITSTQIFFNGVMYNDVKVEIQLRTSFQNAWSMKTHELTYKRNSEYGDEVSQKMKQLSNILYEADKVSLEMKRKISGITKKGIDISLFNQ